MLVLASRYTLNIKIENLTFDRELNSAQLHRFFVDTLEVSLHSIFEIKFIFIYMKIEKKTPDASQ